MMVSKVCELGRKKVHELEMDYVNGLSKSRIAKKYGVPWASVDYYLKNRLPDKIVKGAEVRSAAEGSDLMQKIDQLFESMEDIFRRNYAKENDGIALKALNSQRNTIELLAKISYALHQNKILELEQKQNEFLNVDLPLERLTETEQHLYFELTRKIMGDIETVDISDYTDFVESSPGISDGSIAVDKSINDKNDERPKNSDPQLLTITKDKNKPMVRRKRDDNKMTFIPPEEIDEALATRQRNAGWRRGLNMKRIMNNSDNAI